MFEGGAVDADEDDEDDEDEDEPGAEALFSFEPFDPEEFDVPDVDPDDDDVEVADDEVAVEDEPAAVECDADSEELELPLEPVLEELEEPDDELDPDPVATAGAPEMLTLVGQPLAIVGVTMFAVVAVEEPRVV